MSARRIEVRDALGLAESALVASGASRESAASTASALVSAEIDGQAAHGLSRVASYSLLLKSGKVNGTARPVAKRIAPAVIRIDAGNGFAYPAIDLAIGHLAPLAREMGIAAAGIHDSGHFGQAGRHVERLAESGLVAMAFANTPRAMAFHGGRRAMMGTNPIAFAAPLADRAPLVIDLALSVAARGKIIAAGKAGKAIPAGWAVDAHGAPTTDPAAALQGALLPIGDAKGGALALMIEILSAALVGGAFGWEASSFFDAEGGPPRLGQLLLAFFPEAFSGPAWPLRMQDLAIAIAGEAPARLPGDRRLAARARAAASGIEIPDALYAELRALAGSVAA